jgi:acetyl-CoA carboxylase carboxyl transferase subunit alpha
VISPEGCAAILWNDRGKAADAAEAMKLTAEDLAAMKVVDGVVPEPPGGAHRDLAGAAAALGDVLEGALKELEGLPPDELLARRMEKYRHMGSYLEGGTRRGLGHS